MYRLDSFFGLTKLNLKFKDIWDGFLGACCLAVPMIPICVWLITK